MEATKEQAAWAHGQDLGVTRGRQSVIDFAKENHAKAAKAEQAARDRKDDAAVTYWTGYQVALAALVQAHKDGRIR